MRQVFLMLTIWLAPTVQDQEPVVRELEAQFRLKVGQSARIADQDLTILFADVPSDSRCPKDVNCIRAGEAIVRLQLESEARALELAFGVPPGGSDVRQHQGYLISVLTLEPEPDSRRRIEAEDYEATLMVEPNPEQRAGTVW